MKKIKKYNKSNDIDSLKHKLASYAALAGTFVALSPEANAQCPLPAGAVLDDSGEIYEVDFDGDGTIDVTIGFFSTQSTYVVQSTRVNTFNYVGGYFPYYAIYYGTIYYTSYFYYTNVALGYVIPGAGNGVLGTGFFASATGGVIGSGGPFQTNTQYLNYNFTSGVYFYYNVYLSTYVFFPIYGTGYANAYLGPYGPATVTVSGPNNYQGGNFAGGGGEYIGVEFVGADGETHYGWVEVDIDPATSAITVVGFGSNCQGLESADAPADAAITAGQCPPPCCSANAGTFPGN